LCPKCGLLITNVCGTHAACHIFLFIKVGQLESILVPELGKQQDKFCFFPFLHNPMVGYPGVK
jgi:hypothetical protein